MCQRWGVENTDATGPEHREQVIITHCFLFFIFLQYSSAQSSSVPLFCLLPFLPLSPCHNLLLSVTPRCNIPSPPSREHEAMLTIVQKRAPGKQQHVREVVLLTQTLLIFDKISSCLKYVVTMHGNSYCNPSLGSDV